MTKVFITLLLLAGNNAISAELEGKFLCEGDAVLQMHVVGDKPEEAKIKMVVDFTEQKVIELDIQSRLPSTTADLSLTYDSEKEYYYFSSSKHGGSFSLYVWGMSEETVGIFVQNQYWHHAAGMKSKQFNYEIDPLECVASK